MPHLSDSRLERINDVAGRILDSAGEKFDAAEAQLDGIRAYGDELDSDFGVSRMTIEALKQSAVMAGSAVVGFAAVLVYEVTDSAINNPPHIRHESIDS